MGIVARQAGRFEWSDGITLTSIASHYRARIAITWMLLLGEAFALLFFPLAIGFSVDSLIEQSHSGLTVLGGLCLILLLFAAGRRFYDTRVYAAIYQDMATTLVESKRKKGTSTTRLTAQVNLLYEIVSFFEDALPTLIGALITFAGVTLMLGWIDFSLMSICLATSVLVALIYAASEKRIFTYNKHQNDELEQQVDVLEENRQRRVRVHFGRIMKWNIRLSDLETLNFSAIWIVMAALLVGSIVLVVGNGGISYGQKITAIMYVFEYIEVVMGFPLFYQEAIRLQEIAGRLSSAS